ncbi:MAG: SDR family oxidoreductase [Candidatus Promineifilaceae bacterium]
MAQTVLVLGATGMLGEPVARHLQQAGLEVRVLARNEDKARRVLGDACEIRPGDVTDLPGLEEAMAGCDAVHISISGEADVVCAEQVARLAPQTGVKQIGYVSGSTIRAENAWFPMTAQKMQAETAVTQSGVPYTIFRPTWPMEQLPNFVNNGQATVIGDRPLAWRWFAADDMGRMVANAYQREEALGKTFYIHGPQSLTTNEAVERYCRAFYPEIESVTMMPIEVARSVAAASGNEMLGGFDEMMAYFQQVGEPGDPAEANALLGAPTITLDDWIARRQEAAK